MNKKVLLIEEPLFFTQYDFHIQKLILHKFYINRRKELNIFMQNGKPLFDKYSFDEDNRKNSKFSSTI